MPETFDNINPSRQNLKIKREKLEKFVVPTQAGYQLFNTSSILYLEASHSYTNIHLDDKSKVVSSKNLGFFEEELENEPFLRIHNSFIINLNKVKSYVRGDEGYIVLQNGFSIRVSKARKDDLLMLFRSRSMR